MIALHFHLKTDNHIWFVNKKYKICLSTLKKNYNPSSYLSESFFFYFEVHKKFIQYLIECLFNIYYNV